MAAYTPDNVFVPILLDLKTCLEAEMNAAGLGAGCSIQMLPAPATAPGGPNPGMGHAWVGMINQFQSATFPQPYTGVGDCGKPWAAAATMGIIRCSSLTKMGIPAEGWEVIADRQAADMRILRRSIRCCAISSEHDFAIGNLTPIDYEGGTYGARLDFFIGQ